MNRYTPFFESTKIEESFTSQKAIYKIADSIVAYIRPIFIQAIKDMYAEGMNSTFIIDNVCKFDKGQSGSDIIFTAYFPLVNIFRKIEDYDLSNMKEYRFLESFYEKNKYANLHLELKREQGTRMASYDVISKHILVYLEDNHNDSDKFESDPKASVNGIIYHNKLNLRLVHELTHLYDDMISQERAITQKMSNYINAEVDAKKYLQNPAEVNARFYQASYDALYEKLYALTSQASLKHQWERKYLPIISKGLIFPELEKEQVDKLRKRAWVEFTTLDRYEEKVIIEKSIEVMLNSGDVNKSDIRLKNKKEPRKVLRQLFLDLQDKKISTVLFIATEPLMNDEWQKNDWSQVHETQRLVQSAKWQQAENLHNLYKKIRDYGKDEYETKLIDNILKQLNLNSYIIDEIREKYRVK